MSFVPLEKLINLHAGYRREFRLDYHRLLLIEHHGQHHIIEALCPHQEHPLEEGWIEDGELLCPLHGYRFSLLTGKVIQASREPCRPLRVWPVAYEGAAVGVEWISE
ncbi:MAG: Rieske 2Fe-2S domain-containing protein [Pseudomonadota bacterium]